MGRPMSPPNCMRCGADAGAVRLYPVSVHRSVVLEGGRRTTRAIPTRICQACAGSLIAASDRARRDWLAPSAGPRSVFARASASKV
jgi:hypothetical protein